MNRKQKIIVSITGIVIVVLALLGLTYAYFVTQIQGNPNSKSIEISTANLRLVYADSNPEILSKSNIIPGDTIGSKIFTVTNEGNTTVENYVVYLENVTNTFERQEDVTYVLNCSSSDSTPCNGSGETVYPNTNKILVLNNIAANTVHTYEITVQYKEAGVDQSVDMNKTITGKLNIYDIRKINPYATISEGVETSNNTLAYNIVNNAKSSNLLTSSPLSKPGENSPLSEKELSIAEDDYGISYYYRGVVANNYLEFNNKCWRIVRIQGDGSIKITLANNGTCESATSTSGVETEVFSFVYKMNDINSYNTTNYKTKVENWLTSSGINSSKLKKENWCYDASIVSTTDGYYADYDNIRFGGGIRYGANVSLKCPLQPATNIETSTYIAGLTNDEILFAGSKRAGNYLLDEGISEYWTITPDSLSAAAWADSDNILYIFTSSGYGRLSIDAYENGDYEYEYLGYRPTVVLEAGTNVTGTGTKENPYIVQ